jgi:hypothetical protein
LTVPVLRAEKDAVVAVAKVEDLFAVRICVEILGVPDTPVELSRVAVSFRVVPAFAEGDIDHQHLGGLLVEMGEHYFAFGLLQVFDDVPGDNEVIWLEFGGCLPNIGDADRGIERALMILNVGFEQFDSVKA